LYDDMINFEGCLTHYIFLTNKEGIMDRL